MATAGPPTSPELAEVLAPAAAAAHGWLVSTPLGCNGATAGAGWVGVDELLADPSRIDPLLEATGRRFRSDDRALLVAQVAREAVSALVTAAVHLWAGQRRLPALDAATVALRATPTSTQVGLRRLRLAVLPGDPLAGRSDVEVADEPGLLGRLLDRVIGHPMPSRAVPVGPAHDLAAVAGVIAAVRRAVRCGDRHLWGTAALAAGTALTAASHTAGARADRDRAALFASRPDLARTVELVTVDDGLGGEVTFPLRRTCCLLYKLPGRTQCGTCSLRDHDACVAWTAGYHRSERRRARLGPS